MGASSSHRRLMIKKRLPRSISLDLRDRFDRGFHFMIAVVKMRGETNPRARAIVAEDVRGLERLGDFVAVVDVDRHGSAAVLGPFWR